MQATTGYLLNSQKSNKLLILLNISDGYKYSEWMIIYGFGWWARPKEYPWKEFFLGCALNFWPNHWIPILMGELWWRIRSSGSSLGLIQSDRLASALGYCWQPRYWHLFQKVPSRWRSLNWILLSYWQTWIYCPVHLSRSLFPPALPAWFTFSRFWPSTHITCKFLQLLACTLAASIDGS